MPLFKQSRERKELNNIMKATTSDFKNFLASIPSLIKNQKQKPKEERSTALKALILTLVIVSIIIFIFLKVPFLKTLLFP